jgi:hypothetical protein
MLGQHVMPRAHHPLVDAVADEKVTDFLDDVRGTIRRCVEAMALTRTRGGELRDAQRALGGRSSLSAGRTPASQGAATQSCGVYGEFDAVPVTVKTGGA